MSTTPPHWNNPTTPQPSTRPPPQPWLDPTPALWEIAKALERIAEAIDEKHWLEDANPEDPE